MNPEVRVNYLGSPMLVVAYALAGSMQDDLIKEPLGHDKNDEPALSSTSGRHGESRT